MSFDARLLAALALSIVAAGFDLRVRRIPNALTLPAMIAGVVWAAIRSGWRAAAVALGITIAVLVIGFLANAVGIFGGGDAKLIAGIASLVGGDFLIEILLWTAVTGGVVAIAILALKGKLIRFLRSLGATIFSLARQLEPERPLIEGEGEKIAYAVIIACGVAATVIATAVGFTWNAWFAA